MPVKKTELFQSVTRRSSPPIRPMGHQGPVRDLAQGHRQPMDVDEDGLKLTFNVDSEDTEEIKGLLRELVQTNKAILAELQKRD